jgi:hypothetical protein
VIPQPDLPVTPVEFVGRKPQLDAFRQALQQGLIAGRASSFAVLGDQGTGESSSLLKFGALCSEPTFEMLPVFTSDSSNIHDYLRFAETLLDKFANALLTWPKMRARVRTELQNWGFKRANLSEVVSERETSRLFLTSGSSLLSNALKEARDRFLRPAQSNGAIFFAGNLQNVTAIPKADLLMTITNQFQTFGVVGVNYSICFSATAAYFAEMKGVADQAPRFCSKLYLEPFTVEETIEYVRSVFGTSGDTTRIVAARVQENTLGHPYFVAFVCGQLAATESEIRPDQLETIWPAIFDQLEREKFRPDISQLSVKELDLIRRFASLDAGEFRARQIAGKFQREYFARLVEKRLLIRTKRGRYKLYHPLFREFLRQTK